VLLESPSLGVNCAIFEGLIIFDPRENRVSNWQMNSQKQSTYRIAGTRSSAKASTKGGVMAGKSQIKLAVIATLISFTGVQPAAAFNTMSNESSALDAALAPANNAIARPSVSVFHYSRPGSADAKTSALEMNFTLGANQNWHASSFLGDDVTSAFAFSPPFPISISKCAGIPVSKVMGL